MGDDDHLVDLFMVEHRSQDQLVLRVQIAAQAICGADRQLRDLEGLLIASGEHAAADRLMNFGLGGKEAIDIGGRHAKIASDIGDIRLGIAIMPEQPLRRLQNPRNIVLPCGVEDIAGFVHEQFRFTTDEFKISSVVNRNFRHVNCGILTFGQRSCRLQALVGAQFGHQKVPKALVLAEMWRPSACMTWMGIGSSS